MIKGRFALRRGIILLLLLAGVLAAILGLTVKRRSLDNALIASIQGGDTASVQHLLEAGANPNAELVSTAPDAFEALLDMLKRSVGMREHPSTTALRLACTKGNNEIIESLLYHGANLQQCDPEYGTCLATAISAGQDKTVDYLIKKGIDVNAHERNGFTPLMIAAEKGNLNIVSILIQKGADTNAKTDMGDTALMRSIHDNTGHSTLAILRGGCFVDAQNVDQETALQIASRTGHAMAVKYLLEYGANATVHNKDGLTALQALQQSSRKNGRTATSADQTIIALLKKYSSAPQQR